MVVFDFLSCEILGCIVEYFRDASDRVRKNVAFPNGPLSHFMSDCLDRSLDVILTGWTELGSMRKCIFKLAQLDWVFRHDRHLLTLLPAILLHELEGEVFLYVSGRDVQDQF